VGEGSLYVRLLASAKNPIGDWLEVFVCMHDKRPPLLKEAVYMDPLVARSLGISGRVTQHWKVDAPRHSSEGVEVADWP
jgi:hypothetical protein